MNCYWPVEIPIKETNETKSFGFRGKIARQFKNTKHVNTVFQIQLFFSHEQRHEKNVEYVKNDDDDKTQQQKCRMR